MRRNYHQKMILTIQMMKMEQLEIMKNFTMWMRKKKKIMVQIMRMTMTMKNDHCAKDPTAIPTRNYSSDVPNQNH